MISTDNTTTGTERPTAAQRAHAGAYTPWQLAQMADVASPDSLTSPGAVWLRSRVDDALEIMDYDAERAAREGFDTGEWDADDITAAADSAVPVYTYQKWQVFTDLGAWRVDIEEWGGITDMDQGASLALYVTAETLITALLSDLDDVTGDSDDADDPAADMERARFGTLHVTCDTPSCPCDGGPWHSDVRTP